MNEDEIRKLRRRIDKLTFKILELMAERKKLAMEIGEIKREMGKPIIDLSREKKLTQRIHEQSIKLGLNYDSALRILNILVSEGRESQGEKDREPAFYRIFREAKEMDRRGNKVIHLEIGEPGYGPPETVISKLKGYLVKKYMTYTTPMGIEELRKAIIEKVNSRYNLNLGTENIAITPGGKFAVYAAITTNLSPGEKVVIFDPSWPIYRLIAEKAGGLIVNIETRIEDNWEIDLSSLEDVIDESTKLILLNTPNNPTGKMYRKRELDEINEIANRKNLLLLSDETYSEITFNGMESLLEHGYQNIIYVNSFSKTYGMTGFRLGYVIANKQIIQRIKNLISLSITCVPPFIQKAALYALSSGEEEKYRLHIRKNLMEARGILSEAPVEFKAPDGGLYIFFRVKRNKFNSANFAEKLLLEEKVAVAPGESFGNYNEFIRVNISGNFEELRKGLKILARRLRENQ